MAPPEIAASGSTVMADNDEDVVVHPFMLAESDPLARDRR
jgi:hypothetical protein